MHSNVNPPNAADDIRNRLSRAQWKLDRLTHQLLSAPKASKSLLPALTEVTELIRPIDVSTVEPELHNLLTALQSRIIRVHLLLESALLFHCGALLTNPQMEYTYTPDGKMFSAVGGATLSLQA